MQPGGHVHPAGCLPDAKIFLLLAINVGWSAVASLALIESINQPAASAAGSLINPDSCPTTEHIDFLRNFSFEDVLCDQIAHS